MRLSLIAAVAENGAIGLDGGLPWHLPADLKFFMKTTVGHTLIMGRKTFDSLDDLLPKRRLIVVTRDRDYRAEGVEVVHDLDAAYELARDSDDEVFVAGGSEIFRLALPVTDRFYLTRVHAEPEADTFFPEVDWSRWRLVEEEHHPADERHAHAMSFQIYDKAE